MSLCVASLNSGSNANAYYVGTRQYGVLIDAGLGFRQMRDRMAALNIDPKSILAVFISHEHIDHVRGLPQLVKTYDLPVYASPKTWDGHACLQYIPHKNRNYFICGNEVVLNDMRISCFGKQHDGVDPHSFVVERQDVRVGIFTDLGEACQKTTTRFSTCHAIILEANYDDEMLENGRYPYYLKRRIAGPFGHLSNAQALQLYLKHRSKNLQLLMLGHLSKENNCPDLVRNLFYPHTRGLHLEVASRYTHSPLFEILPARIKTVMDERHRQLSLF